MCGLTAAATIGGMIMSVGGALYSGQQQKKLADRNASIDMLNAKRARARGELEQDRLRVRKVLAQGQENVARAGSGIQASGSPLWQFAFNAEQGELDSQIQQYNTEMEALGYVNRANTSKYEGGVAQTASIFKAGQAAFSGYTKGKELGVFG